MVGETSAEFDYVVGAGDASQALDYAAADALACGDGDAVRRASDDPSAAPARDTNNSRARSSYDISSEPPYRARRGPFGSLASPLPRSRETSGTDLFFSDSFPLWTSGV